MRDEYADWDAAYVLGALSSSERREYEDHVDGCARCAAAVAELGMLPGLLRLVPDHDAAAYLQSEPPPRLVPVPEPARPPSRRRLPVKALAAAAAVLLVVGVGAGIVVTRDGTPTRAAETVALGTVVSSPLRATVSLIPRSWGTEVAMTCTYAGEYGAARPYALYVVDRSGNGQVVSRWRAGPGDTSRTTGATDLAPADIARIELRSADGTLLLARTL